MTDPSAPPGPPSDADRLNRLEHDVAELRAEVAAIRAALGAGTSATAIRALRRSLHYAPGDLESPASASAERPATPRRRISIEELIGRYGMLVLATLTLLTAVGSFLGWAIARGWLGPAVRVAFGVVAAVVLAVLGVRLRRRERAFGGALLAIALAVVEVCAWGAGPALALVPRGVAFAVAVAASLALAGLAWREGDEALWCAGFVGAAIAPFVTSAGEGAAAALFAYALVTSLAGLWSLAPRRWPIAATCLVLGVAADVAALALAPATGHGPALAALLPMLVAAVGVMAWIAPEARRAWLRPFGALAALAALVVASHVVPQALVLPGAAGLDVVWVALLTATLAIAPSSGLPRPGAPALDVAAAGWIDAALIPLGFLLAAWHVLPASWHPAQTATLAAWCALALVGVWRWPAGALCDGAAALAVGVAAMLVIHVSGGRELAEVAALAIVGVAASTLALPRRSPSLAWGALLVLAAASARGSAGLAEAGAHGPFGTAWSGDALLLLAAWSASAWAAWHVERSRDADAGAPGASAARAHPASLVVMLRLAAPWLWGVWWGREEIVALGAPSAVTLGLIVYYAALGTAGVLLGRRRDNRALRRAGLALAVLAAWDALVASRQVSAIGARIGITLCVTAFLLAIAYAYRRRGRDASIAETPALP